MAENRKDIVKNGVVRDNKTPIEAKFVHFARFAQFATKDLELEDTKTIPKEVYANLPEILKKGSSVFTQNREKDVFLTGALGVLSGCFNTVKGLYASEEHYANLNCFIVSGPGAGKGAMKHSKTLGKAVDRKFQDETKQSYEVYHRESVANEKLLEPPQRMLFIPANSSSSAVIRHLHENNESGIICETEADTLADTFKNEWGSYSDLIRKAFHHENVSYSRKKDREFIDLEQPKLSVVLSGTPDQVKKLIQSSENGLFSRFLFYGFEEQGIWRSVAPTNNKLNLNKYFSEMSEEVKIISEKFSEEKYVFELTENQWIRLDNQFSKWLNEITTFIHKDTASVIKRLGLIQFRIAMILSILRCYESENVGTTIKCQDEDFKTAEILTSLYLEHGLKMFFNLPRESKLVISQDIKRFFDILPTERDFPRDEAIKIGVSIGIKERTIGKYLNRLVEIGYLKKPKYGFYLKS